MDFKKFIELLINNKEWLFDGFGTNLIVLLLGWGISAFSYSKGQKHEIEKIVKLQNLIIDYKKHIDLTIGASGATYIAPADGCFNISSLGKLKVYIDNICVQSIEKGVITQNVIKGQKIKIEYEKQIESLTFYYAKEEENGL